MKIFARSAIFRWAALAAAACLLAACNGKSEEGSAERKGQVVESFTFFNLGAGSRLTKQVRKDLEDKLGNEAVEVHGTLDLETNFKGFLKAHFPYLDRLNRRLNTPPGERVEHDTVRLMYRYARTKNAPFDYVDLLFSKKEQTPLLFRIDFQKGETTILETLKRKYGEPAGFAWKSTEKEGRAYAWKKNQDVLLLTATRDLYGRLKYRIMIYFTANLEKMAAAEQRQRESAQQQVIRSGKNAF